MKNLEISLSDVRQIADAAKNILHFSIEKKVFAFYGEMGSGKTTLIKELCHQLGSQDNFSSPTYSIVNEYQISTPLTTHLFNPALRGNSPHTIYHMDLFRLKTPEEALAAGVEEYIDSNSYCFIEWPELIEALLHDDVVKISIQPDGNIRNLSIFSN